MPQDEWLDQTGIAGTYSSIADPIGDTTADATYLASPINPEDGDHFEVSLGNLVPPLPDAGIFVRYRYGMLAGSDAAIDLEVELLKGATVIANQVKFDIQTVSGYQVASSSRRPPTSPRSVRTGPTSGSTSSRLPRRRVPTSRQIVR